MFMVPAYARSELQISAKEPALEGGRHCSVTFTINNNTVAEMRRHDELFLILQEFGDVSWRPLLTRP